MNNSITPTLTRAVAREKYQSDIESWKNFAQRITKNPFVKTFLLARDGHNCSWCQRNVTEHFVIHHISYDHFCGYNRLIRIVASTTKRPHRERQIPDCENCKKDSNQRFLICMSKLVLVHCLCNKQIADLDN
jgi:hypothetical protein